MTIERAIRELEALAFEKGSGADIAFSYWSADDVETCLADDFGGIKLTSLETNYALREMHSEYNGDSGLTWEGLRSAIRTVLEEREY